MHPKLVEFMNYEQGWLDGEGEPLKREFAEVFNALLDYVDKDFLVMFFIEQDLGIDLEFENFDAEIWVNFEKKEIQCLSIKQTLGDIDGLFEAESTWKTYDELESLFKEYYASLVLADSTVGS